MIIMHLRFSNLALFMQRTNLVEKLPIYCIQKLPKLFSFCLKQMPWQSHIYFRIHQLQSVPTPIKLRNHEPEHFRVATFHIFNKTMSNHFSIYLYWTKGEQTSKQKKRHFKFKHEHNKENPLKCAKPSPHFYFSNQYFSCKEKKIGQL